MSLKSSLSVPMQLCVGLIIIASTCARGVTSDADASSTEHKTMVSVSGPKNQHALVVEWAKSLTPDLDYKGTTQWEQTFGTNDAGYFFNEYCDKFSAIAEKVGATVNFVSIGACDGTADKAIRNGFLKHSHWNGIFVEPMSNNFADLTTFLEVNGVSNRSTALKGAATSYCANAFIEVQRPLFEEKDPTLAHWMRREIGSILDDGQKVLPGWAVEKVR